MKQKIINFFINIAAKIYFFFNKKKIEKKLESQEEIDFKNKYNVDLKKVLELMDDTKLGKYFNPKTDYHNEVLIKARAEISKINQKAPLFFEPEICEIHNENFQNSNSKTLKEIIDEDHQRTYQQLKDKENFLNGKNKYFWKLFNFSK